jgi:hypothetical protein
MSRWLYNFLRKKIKELTEKNFELKCQIKELQAANNKLQLRLTVAQKIAQGK